jgi:hypothetical protein
MFSMNDATTLSCLTYSSNEFENGLPKLDLKVYFKMSMSVLIYAILSFTIPRILVNGKDIRDLLES